MFSIESLQINTSGVASTSRGLVGDTVFAVIPNFKPIHTFAITIAFQLVSLCSTDMMAVLKYFIDILG